MKTINYVKTLFVLILLVGNISYGFSSVDSSELQEERKSTTAQWGIGANDTIAPSRACKVFDYTVGYPAQTVWFYLSATYKGEKFAFSNLFKAINGNEGYIVKDGISSILSTPIIMAFMAGGYCYSLYHGGKFG